MELTFGQGESLSRAKVWHRPVLCVAKCLFTEHPSSEWPCLTGAEVQSSLSFAPSRPEMAGEGALVDDVQGAGRTGEGNKA